MPFLSLPRRNVTQRAGTMYWMLILRLLIPMIPMQPSELLLIIGNDKVVPQTWVDGTGSKINTSITTNQVHRVSWDVKQDWNT